jgi:hypothetical protein
MRMKQTARANAALGTALSVALSMALLATLTPVAATAAQAPLIFPLNKGRHPGKTVTTGVQRPVAPIGNLRVVKPLGGTRPPAKTILAKRPS